MTNARQATSPSLSQAEAFRPEPGPHNALTDVEGLLVGHFTSLPDVSGITVIVCPQGAVAGVDVRGSAPGTRETDLLAPLNLVEKAQAVVLAGGSVYGLAAADGVVRWLAAKGWGFPLAEGHVAPIVPAACLYDLGRGQAVRPAGRPPVGRGRLRGRKRRPRPHGHRGGRNRSPGVFHQGGAGYGQRTAGKRHYRGRPGGGQLLGQRDRPDKRAALGGQIAVGGRAGRIGIRGRAPPLPRLRPRQDETPPSGWWPPTPC